MNYIVMDLEFNWPYGNQLSENNGIRLRDEIIEIGAVKLNNSLSKMGTFTSYVCPVAYSKVNKKVYKLTGISTKMLWYRNNFPVTIQRFLAWCGEEYSYITWSSRDIRVLKENMAYHNVMTDCSPMCYDIQKMFDDQVSKLGRAVALKKAIEELDVNLKGRHLHDALWDAIGTAEIFRKLDLREGLDAYAVL